MYVAGYIYRLVHSDLERGPRAEAEGVPHISRGSCQHLVEDVIGALLGRLGTDTRLLQQVVRHMTTNNFKLRREGIGKVKRYITPPPIT